MRLVKMKEKEIEKAGIPFRLSTVRKWRHDSNNPLNEAFVRIGGKVFLDLDRFNKIVSRMAEEQAKERGKERWKK